MKPVYIILGLAVVIVGIVLLRRKWKASIPKEIKKLTLTPESFSSKNTAKTANNLVNLIKADYDFASGFIIDCSDRDMVMMIGPYISFAIENLNIPIIFCLSADVESAKQLIQFNITEVCIFNSGKLHRACRPTFILTESNYIMSKGDVNFYSFNENLMPLPNTPPDPNNPFVKFYIANAQNLLFQKTYEDSQLPKLLFLFSTRKESEITVDLMAQDFRGEII